MKDNINNYFGTAPDKGSMTGPILASLNSSTLAEIHGGNGLQTIESRQNTDDFWLSSLGSDGQVSDIVLFYKGCGVRNADVDFDLRCPLRHLDTSFSGM